MNREKLKVVMFTGGRGTGTISKAFLAHDQIALTLLVNAFDDGLSTGALREFIPGMLGPSDIRKNIQRLIVGEDISHSALRFLLDYRFPETIRLSEAKTCLEKIAGLKTDSPLQEIQTSFSDLSLRQAQDFSSFAQSFLDYFNDKIKNGSSFSFADCSLGNLLFAGCYLQSENSFNTAVRRFSQVCGVKGEILNLTDGQNLVLAALKENGTLLSNEAEIVSSQDDTPIEELFLLRSYLDGPTMTGWNKTKVRAHLQSLDVTPGINPEARLAIEKADIIIYGPGTQHSSLFPSYLTENVGKLIAGNKNAEKIFVGNIHRDFEIRSETAATLVQKLFYYLGGKGKTALNWQDLVTLFFFQNPSTIPTVESDYVTFNPKDFPYSAEKVILTDWETADGKHSGGRVVDELINVVNMKLQKTLKPFRHTVSIVVPGLDEERTIQAVLHDLTLLNFEPMGLGKEIIFVDGGSSDKTLELAQSVHSVKIFRNTGKPGRGATIRVGVERATGDIVVFFPSDAEYQAQDVLTVVRAIVDNGFQAVFGSRAIKCLNLDQRLRKIYQGNTVLYLVGKYGGMLISVISLFLYNRFVSDPLTGLKAFDTRLLRSLDLKSNGLNLETEILAKLGKRAIYILEVPVEFRPRTRREGKKTTFFHGLTALGTLLREWATS